MKEVVATGNQVYSMICLRIPVSVIPPIEPRGITFLLTMEFFTDYT